MSRLLITGIPGTGKTSLGIYLASQNGIPHIDLEDQQTITNALRDIDAFILSLADPVVATWGFPPQFIDIVLKFKSMGFIVVWMDGNRWAAFRAFLDRGTVSEAAFYNQMLGIEIERVRQRIQPVIVNPFENDGSF